MFGMEEINALVAPVEKVRQSIQGILFKEIRRNRMSLLRANIINEPTFLGIAPSLPMIDEEGPETTLNTFAADVIYADDGTGYKKPMVFFSGKWIDILSDAQRSELLEDVLSKNITEDGVYKLDVISEDLTKLIPLNYNIREVTASEVETKTEEATGEDSTTTEECEVPGTVPPEDPEELEAKETEDTMASFTKLNTEMTGAINDFLDVDTPKMVENEVSRIQNVQDILEDGMRFQGRGKAKTAVPSKRLNIKTIMTETSEMEYFGKKEGAGKKVKIMLTIDRSGSMSGQPTRESNILMSALNNIVLDNPELEVEVMLSYTGSYTKFKLPVGSKFSPELWKLTQTGNAEYLWQNISNNMESIESADINLVYTDGSICDDAIDKVTLDRRDVTLTGLYVSDAMGTENLKNHYARNKMYFHHVVVRPSVDELAQEISEKIFTERSTR